MRIDRLAFGVTDCSEVEATEHRGERGIATWRTRQFGDVRVRMVDYSAGYVADHWCRKGHFVLCIEGRLETELTDGRVFELTPGQSYQVGDECEAHRSRSAMGAKLFIVD